MHRVAGFFYGIGAYLISLGTMAYLAGFLGNFLVPKSIDSGSPGSLWTALAVNALLLGLFGLQHSGMAREEVKGWLARWIPDLLVRSTYVLASSVVLMLLFWLWRPMPAVIWSVESAVGEALLWGLFGAGWLVLGAASDAIDALHLNGLRQAHAYLKGRAYDPPEFQTPSLYRYTRHPLMLGFLIAFWATPHMTAGHLLFAAVMTGYIYVGIVFEERALIRAFGERYRKYRRETPMLIPGTTIIPGTRIIPGTGIPDAEGG